MERIEEHPQHAAIRAAFPAVKLDGGGLTIAQARVCFHMERVFRSTGAGMREHALWVQACRGAGLPDRIGQWSPADCALALSLMAQAARAFRMHLFRQVAI